MTKKSVVSPTMPKVSLKIEDKEYFLCFDFNALATAESLTNLNLLQAMDFKNVTAQQLRGMFFSALLKFQPTMTLEDAGALLNYRTIGLISQSLVTAFYESHPEPESTLKNVETPEKQ